MPLRIGLAASAVAFGLLAFAHDAPWLALVWMGLLGVGIAFALAAIGTLVDRELGTRARRASPAA